MKRFLPVLMGFALLLLSSTEGWGLPTCSGSPTNYASTAASWTDCFGTWTTGNGNKYVTEWKNGKQHGHGTLTFGPKSKWAGDKYVGKWKDGKQHGQGTETYANGGKYVGEFKDGKRYGQGTFTHANGRIEEGIWENDELK